ncbi:hypothetical protein RB596_009594 [Gaeumannomyces avenae]
MAALFNFQSLLLVILLLICTSTYVHAIFPALLDNRKDGFMGIFWKSARVGERLSPYISICCVAMAVSPQTHTHTHTSFVSVPVANALGCGRLTWAWEQVSVFIGN